MIKTAIVSLNAVALAFALSGCAEKESAYYRVVKDASPVQVEALPSPSVAPAQTPAAPFAPFAGGAAIPIPDAAMASTPVAVATGAGLAWDAPAQWKAKTASSMRRGSFEVPGAGGRNSDLAITAFPGDVGGDLANINRWRGQLSLPPIGPEQLAAATESVANSGLSIKMADITGTANGAPSRMLGAIVPFANSTWFFKLSGAAEDVLKEKEVFINFLKTVRPAGPVPTAPLQAGN